MPPNYSTNRTLVAPRYEAIRFTRTSHGGSPIRVLGNAFADDHRARHRGLCLALVTLVEKTVLEMRYGDGITATRGR